MFTNSIKSKYVTDTVDMLHLYKNIKRNAAQGSLKSLTLSTGKPVEEGILPGYPVFCFPDANVLEALGNLR